MHKTTIIVKELRHIHSGTSKGGQPYQIQQVVATRQDGTMIDKNLRTFEALPKNEPIEVTVERFQSEEYGVSFTVKPAGKSGGVGKSLDELRGRIVTLEEKVEKIQRVQANAPAPTAVPAPPPPPPGGPMPPPPPGGLPSDDTIPF